MSNDVVELVSQLETLIREELLSMKGELRVLIQEELAKMRLEISEGQESNVKQIRDAVTRHALGLLSMIGKDDSELRDWLDRRAKKGNGT